MLKNVPVVNFASDNAAPVAPQILSALQKANAGAVLSYGTDPLTKGVEEKLKEIFDCDLKAFPVATGTAANALGLSVLVPPYGATGMNAVRRSSLPAARSWCRSRAPTAS